MLGLNVHSHIICERGELQVLPCQAALSLSEEEQLSTAELPNELIQLDALSRLPHQSTLTTTTGEVVPPVERLRKFYQRMNRVTVDKAILEKERDRLAAENAQVRTNDGVTCASCSNN